MKGLVYMNIALFVVGILVILLTLTNIVGQGKLLVKIVSEKYARIINYIIGSVFIILSFIF
jgi:hypothetical protein